MLTRKREQNGSGELKACARRSRHGNKQTDRHTQREREREANKDTDSTITIPVSLAVKHDNCTAAIMGNWTEQWPRDKRDAIVIIAAAAAAAAVAASATTYSHRRTLTIKVTGSVHTSCKHRCSVKFCHQNL